jgi:uncharacterized membrane protein YeaQ/YmgE (transglycosylase-associated protein family)
MASATTVAVSARPWPASLRMASSAMVAKPQGNPWQKYSRQSRLARRPRLPESVRRVASSSFVPPCLRRRYLVVRGLIDGTLQDHAPDVKKYSFAFRIDRIGGDGLHCPASTSPFLREVIMEPAAGAAVGGVVGLLLVALLGLAVGVVAKLVMPGKDPGGWFVTILLGIAGSWIGSFLMRLLGMTSPLAAFVSAVVGAVILLAIYRLIKKQKA